MLSFHNDFLEIAHPTPVNVDAYFTGLSFALVTILILVGKSKDKRKSTLSSETSRAPPLVPGLPFLGSGIAFGRDAVTFLLETQKRLGDFFTVRLPFNRIHFIMNPHGIEAMMQHKKLEFNPIQKMVNLNVFGFRLHEDRKIIREVSKSARQMLNLSFAFRNFTNFLNNGIEQQLQRLDSTGSGVATRMPMKAFLIETQFRAIFNSIFGDSDTHAFNHRSARYDFDIFHKYFNYLWLGFPLWLFSRAGNALKSLVANHPTVDELLARPDLSDYMRTALTAMKRNGQTHSDIVGHNLVFLHVNYNTYKITYWILKYLICHPEARRAVLEEIRGTFETKNSVVINTSIKEIEALTILDSVVNECFRLSSGVLVIREVMEDTSLDLRDMPGKNFSDSTGDGVFDLKKGDKVAFYPPALHKNPTIFDGINEFQYDRFVDKEFAYRGTVLSRLPVQPYGSLCPGQRLSRLQIKMSVIAMLLNFEMDFDPEHATGPQYNLNCYGHEILPPIEDVDILLKPLSRVKTESSSSSSGEVASFISLNLVS